jgi:hypothetical protein
MSESVMVLDMSDLDTKRRLMTKIGSLKGLHEISIKPRKHKRSLTQNAYYFAAFVTPFLEWLREQEGDPSLTTEQAHETLKVAVLGTKVITNRQTGEAIEIPPPTRGMKTDEFSIYLDAAAKWLAEFCEIVVLPAETYFEGESKA